MKNNTRKILSIILNLIVFISMTYCVSSYFFEKQASALSPVGAECFRYFTTDSNIFAGITSLIAAILNIISFKKDIKIPTWFKLTKLASTCSVALTFLTVVIYLGPVYGSVSGNLFLGYFNMFTRQCFHLHFLNPVICIILTIFIDYEYKCDKKMGFVGVIPTFVYGSFYLINVLILKTWPDFYYFTLGGLWYVYLLGMFIVSLVISILINCLTNKNFKSYN